MPLLGKEEFSLKKLPPNLDPDTQVFYCTLTGEAFLSYDEYFERQILCSSMFWTCSVTGKTGLTYLDALKSERESQTLLSSVPRVLQKVLLHLMKYMDNFSTNIVLSILLEYTNLRYFIGENVQVMSSKSKHTKFNGYIRDVIPPEEYDPTASVAYGIDPLKYQYSVEIIEHRKRSETKSHIEIVPSSRIFRPKAMLTREKLRLFLKQHLSAKSSRYDTLSIKEESVKKMGLDHLKWEDIFKGPLPNFKDDTTIVKAYNKRPTEAFDADQSHNGTEEEKNIQVVKKRSSMLTDQKLKLVQRAEKQKAAVQNQIVKEKEKTQKKSKKQKLKEKEKAKLKGKKLKKKGKKDQPANDEVTTPSVSKEDKLEEKKKIKEARRKFEEGTRSWMEKRDDLLCDDLQKLPNPTPVDCDIDINLFGDSLVVLEFINQFKELIIDFSDVFQPNISLELFAQILNDTDVTGPYSDLLQILLKTILLSHENDEEGDLNINKANDSNEDESSFYNNNYSNSWVSTYYGTQDNLAKLKIDAFTLSEILRIYLLKVRNNDLKRSRHNDNQQDVLFAIKLTTQSVFEFSQLERIILFKLLLNDLVKLPEFRQKIEEKMEEIFSLKTQIRHLNASFTKWLRDNPIRQRIRKKKQTSEDAKDDNKGAVAEQSQENEEASQAEKEQYKREKTQKEQQMKKSISELKAEIRKLSAFCRPRPLGMDRAYRRYWVFQSISGLLVEHPIEEAHDREYEYEPRPCLESPLPMPKPQLTDYLPNAKKRKRKSIKKEENAEELLESASNSLEDNVFERCTGDLKNCSVHGSANLDRRLQWAFYTKEQFDELIESLNSRGYRENELKNALILEKNSILKKHLENFIPTALNPAWEPPVPPQEESKEEQIEENLLLESGLLRKSERIQNQNIEKACSVVVPKLPEGTIAKHLKTENKYSSLLPTEAHQVAFQDELLELEDKIYNSCFTSFDDIIRDEWAKKLNSIVLSDRTETIKSLTSLFRAIAENLKSFCLLPPLSVIPDQSASSPSDKENIEHIQPKIPKLSEKWLESLKVAKALQYGDDLNDLESSFGITNLSQLFINLYVFEKSIDWEKSAMKTATKCRVCRRKANEEMILCDMCNRGYHIYCLKPPIRSIDDIEGDWFCYSCAPRSSTNSKKNIPQQKIAKMEEKPHTYAEVEDPDYTEESLDSADEHVCRSCKHELFDEYNEVFCKSCNRGFHLSCARLLRVPRSWCCDRCEANERYNQDHSDDNGEVRRSTRKRKPNIYYDEPILDDNYSGNTGRPKRFAVNGHDTVPVTRMQRV